MRIFKYDNHADTFAFSVSLPEKSELLICWTSEYHSLPFPSSSVLFLEILTLTLRGRFLTPWFQMNWLSLGSILTSFVFIIFSTSNLIWETALGALFLNVALWAILWMLMVVSMAVSLSPFLYSFLPIATNYKVINYSIFIKINN
mgnify:CR=1 FL=1